MEPEHSTSGFRKYIIPLLFLLSIGIFAQAVFHGISELDDRWVVFENDRLTLGLTWEGIAWAFQAGALRVDPSVEYWMPLTLLSRLMDYHVAELAPWWCHLVNVCLHAGAVVLLYCALRRLTSSTWRSAFVAALFACHPLQVETVAWISGRRDGMGGFFWMLTLYAYSIYAARRTRGTYLLTLAAYAGAIMAKPTVVTLPAALLLLDFWPLNRFKQERVRNLVIEKLPLGLMSLICLFTAVLAQSDLEAFHTTEDFPIPVRIANAFASYLEYLFDFIFPWDLVPAYAHAGKAFNMASAWIALALLAPFTCFVILARRSAPWLFTGWFWFGGVLVPMIQLTQLGDVSRADRYMYIPIVGLAIIVAWGGYALLRYFNVHTRSVPAALAVTSVVVFAAIASRQLTLWNDPIRLWTKAVAVTPRNIVALIALGNLYSREQNYKAARPCYLEAIKISYRASRAWKGLAVGAMHEGRPKEAAYHMRRVVVLRPDDLRAKLDLAHALEAAGEVAEANTVRSEVVRSLKK